MAWKLSYDSYEPAKEAVRESLCALGNGCFVTRGAGPESSADQYHYPGTYLAGGYNRLASTIADREIINEDLVNWPNWLPLTFRCDGGSWFQIDRAILLGYAQELDLAAGVLHREIRFRQENGQMTRWRERRFVSMDNPRLACLEVELLAENWDGDIVIRSGIDGEIVNSGVSRYRNLNGRHLEMIDCRMADDDTVLLVCRSSQSHIELAQAQRTTLVDQDGGKPVATRSDACRPGWAGQHITVPLARGRPLRIRKTVAIVSSRDPAISDVSAEALRELECASDFEDLLDAHSLAWAHLWQRCDLQLTTERESPQWKLRLHIFHLLQSVSHHSVDRDVGVPARGWHGEAYRGHVFWDELFIFPYLNLRIPVLTRALLRYRYRRLPEARRAAKAIGATGAMFPWQSGSNGREESQRVHLNPQSGRWIPDASWRQRHVGLAVAYNVWSYWECTGDCEFLADFGAELLLEIARFWAGIAEFDATRKRYDLSGVMGPDEYHTGYPDTNDGPETGLKNNAYTNFLAAWTLTRARDAMDQLPAARCARLRERIGLGDEELAHWEDVSRKLTIPFHDDGRIISQFEGYEALTEFNWRAYRDRYGDIRRLDRILEAEGDTPNRYKLSKQADVLMLFYLFSTEELAELFEQLGYSFDPGMIPENIAYYLERTSHGSTLSAVVHAWVTARSDRGHAWRIFLDALDADIADVQGGTTGEGIHLGAMAGTVDLMQRCFTGLETRANVLRLNPILPENLDCLNVEIRYRGQRLDLAVRQRSLVIRSQPSGAGSVTIAYRGHRRELSPGQSCRFRLIDPDRRRLREGT